MSNHITLTKRVDHKELIAQMQSAGVVLGIDIVGDQLVLNPADAPDLEAQKALATACVDAHVPTTITEPTLAAAPNMKWLLKECLASDGVTSIGLELPPAYPGKGCLCHNSLTVEQRVALAQVAEAHDANTVPTLTSSTPKLVVPADGVSEGQVVITDSRGIAANGTTVRLHIPAGISLVVDADTFVLSGAGQATITFGPTTVLTGEVPLVVAHDSEETDPVAFTVRRGTP